MFSLSDQTLVPTPVSPQNRWDSREVKICGEHRVSAELDMNAAQSTTPSPSSDAQQVERHDRKAAHPSAYSPSLYSEKRLATTSTETRIPRKPLSCKQEDELTPSHKTSADDIPQTESIRLKRNSTQHRQNEYFVGGTSSESKQLDRLSRHSNASLDRVVKESLSKPSSETESLGSSETTQEPDKVRSVLSSTVHI